MTPAKLCTDCLHIVLDVTDAPCVDCAPYAAKPAFEPKPHGPALGIAITLGAIGGAVLIIIGGGLFLWAAGAGAVALARDVAALFGRL